MENKILKKAAIYYILTLVLTIVLGGIMQQTGNILISPQYAPTIALILICLFRRNWIAFKEMNWKLFNNKRWYIWAGTYFLLPFLVVYISSFVLSYFGLSLSDWREAYPNLIVLITSTILGAVLEEVGWRGYFLPLFAKKYNWLTSAVIVGVLWGMWHVSKLSYGILGYLLFIILITEFSIVMTWIYRKTNGNLVLMILFHLGINFASLFFIYNREGIIYYSAAAVIMAIVSIIVVVKNREVFGIKA